MAYVFLRSPFSSFSAVFLVLASGGVHVLSAEAAVLTELNFSRVAYSNLGGQGPDSEELHGIRYEDVARVDGERVDLMVVVKGDGRIYKPADVLKNGHHGLFGRISVRSGTSVELFFKFFKPATSMTATIDHFHFTIYDIGHLSAEGEEQVTLGGFSSYCHPKDSHVAFPSVSQSLHGRLVLSSGIVKRNSSGSPESPFDVTEEQKKRAVTFTFHGVSQFPVRFEVAEPQKSEGRELLFSGVPIRCPSSPREASAGQFSPQALPLVKQPSFESSSSWLPVPPKVPVTSEPLTPATDFLTAATEPLRAATGPRTGATEFLTATTQPPIAAIEPPTAATSPPTAATEPPTAATSSPTAATEPPTAATSSPTAATEPPTAATSSPTAATEPRTATAEPSTTAVSSTTQMHYDCKRLLTSWGLLAWPPLTMRKWCCLHERIGCQTETSHALAIEPTVTHSTSATTLAPIASTVSTLEGMSFHCHVSLWNWEQGWSSLKKTWCCYHESLGCPTSSALPTTTSTQTTTQAERTYDCTAELQNAKLAWSLSKQVWCCHRDGLGCFAKEPSRFVYLPTPKPKPAALRRPHVDKPVAGSDEEWLRAEAAVLNGQKWYTAEDTSSRQYPVHGSVDGQTRD